MYAIMNVMIVVNNRERSIYSKRLKGATIEEFHREAKKLMEIFGNENPNINVSSVKISITSWL